MTQVSSSAPAISSASSLSRPSGLYVLLAKTNSARSVANILSTIHIQKDTVAYCETSELGLKFTVEKANTLQADVYLKEDLFHEYKCTEPQKFGINLSSLLECLNLFGASLMHVSLQISFAGIGHEFQVHLEENGTVSSCNLATIDTPGPVDFLFRTTSVVNKVIFQSNAVKEALAELQFWGETVRIQMAPYSPFFRMSSSGPNGLCQLDFPEGGDCFDMFDCREPRTYSYKMSLLQCLNKALAAADKVALRLNESGMLSMQLMLRENAPVVSFAEFVICADEEVEGDAVMLEPNEE